MKRAKYGCWLIEDGAITMYRYGEKVIEYILPKAEKPEQWTIIDSHFNCYFEYKGHITAQKLSDAIRWLQLLLINNGDVYLIEENGEYVEVAHEVVDYSLEETWLVYMQQNGDAYKYSWQDTQENTLIEKDVVGIKGTECIVFPSDERATSCVKGYYLIQWCE